jgi:hypothetical protein
MKKKLLVVITLLMPTAHYIKKLGIDISSKNIAVKYWNILPILNNKYFLSIKNSKLLRKNKKFKFINTYRELNKEISKLPKNFFYADIVGNRFLGFVINTIMNLKGGISVLVDLGGDIDVKIQKYKSIKYFISKKEFSLLFKKGTIFILQLCFNFLINLFFKKKNPEIVFASNLYTYLKYKKKFRNATIYKINSPDFESYLRIKKNKTFKNKKTIITYLDQGLDENFDYQVRNFKNTKFDPIDFWKKTNFFLRKISLFYPIKKIIIANHPGRLLNNPPTSFSYKFNDSAKLVCKSDFVITTYSLAASLAVLFEKPLILTYLDSFNLQSFIRIAIINFYKEKLGIKCINLKKINNLNKKKFEKLKKKSFSKVKYNLFKKKYLAFPSMVSQGGSWVKILKCLSKYD